MALGADPTVIYAALLAGRYRGTIYQSDLQFDSPYNTYKYPGLPPGPIANPGAGSLQAAMHPASTDFLYFVSDNNGHHRFAQSAAEHDRNVAAYRKGRGGTALIGFDTSSDGSCQVARQIAGGRYTCRFGKLIARPV